VARGRRVRRFKGVEVFKKSFVLALSLALLAAFSVAPPAGSAPLPQATLHSASAVSFNDAAGDSGVAADITDVDVGNDVVAGPIVIWVSLANRPDDLVAADDLAVYLDTDRNPATGDLGAEYVIVVDSESVGAYKWDGTTYAQVQIASLSARFSKADTAVRVAIQPSDLGIAGGFNFSIQSTSGDAYDNAPNGPPDWAYTMSTGPIGLSLSGSAVLPKRAVAGKRLTAAIQIVRSDINEVLTQGKIKCSLHFGKRSVSGRSAWVAGLAVCGWSIPKAAKGHRLSGSVSVTYGGKTVKKSFSKPAH
jgi:hypothetical protein